jgi:vesicle-associated membrane protein 7
MPLIYSLVSRGSTILCEHTDAAGNFTTVTQAILDKIPASNGKMSYVYDKYLFHYIAEDGIVYLCMADEEFGRRIPFAFLDDIKNRFKAAFGSQAKTAVAYSLNSDFAKVLKKQMDYYSNNPNADKLNEVRGEIAAVKEVMVQNIEKVLERGEKMDLLVDKTDNLNQQAFQFKKKSTQLKRQMWWKNTKLMIILAFVGLVIIYLLSGFICGFPAWNKCRGSDDGGGGGGNFTTTLIPKAIPDANPNPNPELHQIFG